MTTVGLGKLWLAAAMLLVGGCASTPEVRNLADRTGVFVTSLDKGTADFAAAQTSLNAANEHRLRRLGLHADALRARVAQQRLAWTRAGATDSLRTQEATSIPATAIVAALKPAAVIEPSVVQFDGQASYGDAAEALVAIGTKPDAAAVLAGLISYGVAVRDAHADLLEQAKESAAATASESEGAVKKTLDGGTAVVEP